MAGKPHAFDKTSTRRIIRTVKRDEGRGGRGIIPHKRRRGGTGSGGGSGETVVTCQVVGAVTSATGTFTADNVDIVFGEDPRADTDSATETIDVNNTFAHEYEDGDLILGFQRDDDDTFETESVRLVQDEVITEITSLAVTGGDLVLTYKKRNIWMVAPDAESGAQTVTTATTTC